MVLRWLMKWWIRFSLWLRFRQIQVEFHAPVPIDQGLIIAGNHQNSLLDSITLAAHSPKVPYTLSRGSLFNTQPARWILESLRLLPIYRFRDGFRKMRENTGAFAQFVEVLKKNGWLLIFPEGSHFVGHTLRPLQRGAARIAFAAQQSEGWKREIPIIPVGLQYESHTAFGSRLLIQFGEPVSTLAFREAHSKNGKEAERALTANLFDEMKSLVVVLPTDEAGHQKALAHFERNQGRFSDLMGQFHADTELIHRLEEDPEGFPAKGEVGAPGSPLKKAAGYLLSIPALILYLPVYLVLAAWEKLFVEDVHIAPGARFTLGMFLVTLWCLGAVAYSHHATGSLILDAAVLVLLIFFLWLRSRTWHWIRFG